MASPQKDAATDAAGTAEVNVGVANAHAEPGSARSPARELQDKLTRTFQPVLPEEASMPGNINQNVVGLVIALCAAAWIGAYLLYGWPEFI